MKAALDCFRVPGEFEEQESVLIMWPLAVNWASGSIHDRDAVAVETVMHLCGNVRTIISCYDEPLMLKAKQKLSTAGVDLDQLEFVTYPCKIVYPRDFGAQVLVNDLGDRMHVDFANTAYGSAPYGSELARSMENFGRFHAAHAGIEETRFSRLVSEGGDREFNGNGVMLTTEDTEIRKRNPGWTKEEVEQEFRRVFNLEKVIWIPRGTYSDECVYDGPIPDEDNRYLAYRSASANGHIDTMCRFVSEDTIILADISPEEAERCELHRLNKGRLDEALRIIECSTTADGRPFNIIRMPVPEPIYVEIGPKDYLYYIFEAGSRQYGGKMWDGSPFPTGSIKVMPALSYCNFLITNGVVIGQKYYREGMPEVVRDKDLAAQKILQQAFPDRKVALVDSLALNMHGGGIHCNTRNVPS